MYNCSQMKEEDYLTDIFSLKISIAGSGIRTLDLPTRVFWLSEFPPYSTVTTFCSTKASPHLKCLAQGVDQALATRPS